MAGAGPLEVGVEVGGAGGGDLEFACHDGRRARAFEVVDEAEVGRGGCSLGEEDGGVGIRCGNGVVDDVAFAIDIEGEERVVVGGEGVGVGEDGEAIVVRAVEGVGAVAGIGGG